MQAELRCHNGILIEYVAEEGWLWILCISGEGVSQLTMITTREEEVRMLVEQDIAELGGRDTARGGFNVEDMDGEEEEREQQGERVRERERKEAVASGLYHLLVAPVEEALASAAHVFVAAAGVLHNLAFELLLTPTGAIWVDELQQHGCSLSCTFHLTVCKQQITDIAHRPERGATAG